MPPHDVMLSITLAFASSSRTFSSTRLFVLCQRRCVFQGSLFWGEKRPGI